jgi:glutathione S-transferase
MEDTVFQIYVVCSSVLVLNLLFLANGTGYARAKSGKALNPEDGKVTKGAEITSQDEGAVARYRRAHMNALENILPFLPMGYLMVLTRPSVAVAAGLFGTFTFFRLAHTFFYLKGKQPGRTISFAIAALALTGVVGVTVVKVFTA